MSIIDNAYFVHMRIHVCFSTVMYICLCLCLLSLRFGSGHEMVLGPLKKYVFACNAFALKKLRAAGRERDR